MIASSDFMQTLAWSLLHFLWQGAAIAAFAAAVMFVFRTPSARYLAGVGALTLMLVSFGVTFAMLSGAPDGSAELLAAREAPDAALVSAMEAPASSVLMESQAAVDSQFGYLWIARIWLVGVCVLALRVAFGLLLLEHLRRRNLVPLPAELVERFRALQQRLGIRRVVRYCECRLVGAPAVIGFFRPIVLLPIRALTGLSEAQLDAVIAHELGHIRRFDVAINFFQVIAETLFFFHPAVWWLNKRIRADREDCCDDIAVAASGAQVGYARALATMAGWRDVPAFAMAATGGPVAARVARLLGVQDGGARRAGVVTASLVLMAAVVAGAVSLGLAQPAVAQTDVVSSEPVVAQVAPPSPASPPKPVKPPSPPAPVAKVSPTAKAMPDARPAPAPRKTSEPQPAGEPRGPSFIAQMESVGLRDLDVDSLVALRIHGVTPEYVREVRASGLDPDLEQLIAMKVHDVSPGYVAEMRGLGFEADLEEIIAMKVHGVDAAYVKGVRNQGENPDADEIIAMKVHDVTPEYRRALEAAGYKVPLEDLIHAKAMDITPEFIAKANAHGFKNLDIDKLIQLKHADVL